MNDHTHLISQIKKEEIEIAKKKEKWGNKIK
jgi:hypothetical protein